MVWWFDLAHLRVLFFLRPGEPQKIHDGMKRIYVSFWSDPESRKWELRLFWLELRWRIHDWPGRKRDRATPKRG